MSQHKSVPIATLELFIFCFVCNYVSVAGLELVEIHLLLSLKLWHLKGCTSLVTIIFLFRITLSVLSHVLCTTLCSRCRRGQTSTLGPPNLESHRVSPPEQVLLTSTPRLQWATASLTERETGARFRVSGLTACAWRKEAILFLECDLVK